MFLCWLADPCNSNGQYTALKMRKSMGNIARQTLSIFTQIGRELGGGGRKCWF